MVDIRLTISQHSNSDNRMAKLTALQQVHVRSRTTARPHVHSHSRMAKLVPLTLARLLLVVQRAADAGVDVGAVAVVADTFPTDVILASTNCLALNQDRSVAVDSFPTDRKDLKWQAHRTCLSLEHQLRVDEVADADQTNRCPESTNEHKDREVRTDHRFRVYTNVHKVKDVIKDHRFLVSISAEKVVEAEEDGQCRRPTVAGEVVDVDARADG